MVTEYSKTKMVGYPENWVVASKGAQNDLLLFGEAMILVDNIYIPEYGAESFVFGSISVASLDETATTVAYTGGTGVLRLEGDYLMKIDHELVHVKADTGNTDATGTLTIVRGAFNTTPATHEAGSGYIMNLLKLTSVNVGDVTILYKGVPLYRDGLNMSTNSGRVWSTVNPNRIYGSEYPTP